jgi:protein-S-isoprenylcysteine O-methyltransferase Ste14
MHRPSQIAWVLFKTAIFTVIAPYFVGLRFPYYVHCAYTVAKDKGFVTLPQVIVGWAFLLLGVVIYLWCAWDFAVKGLGTPAPIDAPKNLVGNGLYRFVRNPMYLGVACLIISQAIEWASVPILVYLAFVIACFHLFIVLYEEPHLRRVFGEQYEDYCRNVRRWIPRLSAYRPPAS